MSVAAPLSSLAQGWGLLYPEGREDLVDAVRPLVAHREVGLRAAWEAGRQRGPPPQVQTWAVPTGWSAADFMRRALDPLTLEEQPRYLLLLGDLDELHLAFQYDLQARFSVGRLCFPSLEGYAAYAQKLIANETRPAEWREPRLLLFSTSQAETPDRTLDHLHEAMIRALHQRFARWEDYNPFNPGSVRLAGPRAEEGLRSWEALRAGAADGQPSVLLTASHGQARSKWEPEEQRALQGGVKLERRTALDPETLTRGALLPGGVWVMWSSFGVGTTKHSIYERFWSELYRAGFYSTMPNLQRLLAKDRPFVARTPMAALANPEGPLAVLGFADEPPSFPPWGERIELPNGQGTVANPYFGNLRLLEQMLRHIGNGQRVGFALSELDREATLIEASLARAEQGGTSEVALVQALLELVYRPAAEGAPKLPDTVIRATKRAVDEVGHSRRVSLALVAARARLTEEELIAELRALPSLWSGEPGKLEGRERKWIDRHSMRTLILLGDPAVDLPLIKSRPAAGDLGESPLGAEPPPAEPLDASRAEALVLDLLHGARPPEDTAEAHGVSVERAREVEAAYTAAGREALRRALKRMLKLR